LATGQLWSQQLRQPFGRSGWKPPKHIDLTTLGRLAGIGIVFRARQFVAGLGVLLTSPAGSGF
jgi:hypothetical protein